MSAIITSKLSPNAAEFQQNSAAVQADDEMTYMVTCVKSCKAVQSVHVPSI